MRFGRAFRTLAGVMLGATLTAQAPSAVAASTHVPRGSWQWQFESRVADTQLDGLLALGRKDIWAFGFGPHGALALHWTGGRWETIRLPGAADFSPFEAEASSANDIWVTGALYAYRHGTPVETSEEILRYNGHSWATVPVPPDQDGQPSDLAVVGAANAWGIMFGAISVCSSRLCTELQHWNGSSWADSTLPFAVTTLQAAPDGQVWAVGQARWNASSQPNGPVVAYTLDRGSWHRVRNLPDPRALGRCGCAVSVAGNNDVWIENAHWNGKVWRLLPEPVGMLVEGPTVPDGRAGVWFGPWALWTGGTWVNMLGPSYAPRWPRNIEGINIHYLARIPGTTTVVAAGSILSRANRNYATILSFGKVP
jgi:hypothetical protein